MKPDSTARTARTAAATVRKPSILGRVAAIVGGLLALLIGADIIGVGICFIGDLVYPRSWSAGAVYAVWFVLGVFVGLIHQQANDERVSSVTAADQTIPNNGNATFAVLIGVTVVALLALVGLFDHMMWSRGIGSPDGYAPDSKSATLTFFITIIVAMIFFRVVAAPTPRREA